MFIKKAHNFQICNKIISWNQAILNQIVFLSPDEQLAKTEATAKENLSTWASNAE